MQSTRGPEIAEEIARFYGLEEYLPQKQVPAAQSVVKVEGLAPAQGEVKAERPAPAQASKGISLTDRLRQQVAFEAARKNNEFFVKKKHSKKDQKKGAAEQSASQMSNGR